jgi:hypothetical protein
MNKKYFYIKNANNQYLANFDGEYYFQNRNNGWAMTFDTYEEAESFQCWFVYSIVHEEPVRNPNFSEKVKIVGI